jgi:hypothetical protein
MLAPRRDVAIVFQDYGKALLPWRTAARNVSLALEAAGGAASERAARIEELLKRSACPIMPKNIRRRCEAARNRAKDNGLTVGKVLSSGARLPCKGGSNGNDYPFRCGVACNRVIGGVGAADDWNLRCGTTSRRYRRAVARDAANRRWSARGGRSTDFWIRNRLKQG